MNQLFVDILYLSFFLTPEINLKEREKERTPFISYIYPEKRIQSVLTPLRKY